MNNDPNTMRQPGDIVHGRYEIRELLGTGSFAEVYRGVDITLEREVAIKLMRLAGMQAPLMGQDEMRRNMMERFLREARVVAKMRSPFSVTLFDFGADEQGNLFMVLEHVPGHTLREEVSSRGPMAPARVTRILQQALSALHEAHAYELLHRDIKPENVMIFEHLGAPDQVRLLDFGIAKALQSGESALTAAGVLVGTPRYVPPERVTGTTLGPASDIYSLGSVAYYLLTGREIYPNIRGAMQILQAQSEPSPIRVPSSPGLPDGLRAVVNQMLEKDLQKRFGSALEALEALERYLTNSSRSSGPSLSYERGRVQTLDPSLLEPIRREDLAPAIQQQYEDDSPTEVVEFDPDMFE